MHVMDGRDLGIVVGYAGTGKSAMLGVAREAWEAAGYEVRGVALSGIAAENLENGSGIASRTIAGMEHGWGQGRDLLTARDVLVIDEAGMVGTRQLERVLSHAADAGAKVVLVGDIKQLQAIEAGAAFRSIHERHGGTEIGEVRRQRKDWQRDATRDLAIGRTGNALEAYRSQGMVHEAATREQARGDLIERWDRDRQAAPDKSRIILTHTNDEVRALNETAREKMREAGSLGDEVRVTVERRFASGDRVMFLQNERGLGVKNGTLGTVEQVNAQSMTVQTDDGRSVRFDLKDYNRIDHGYAATVHKAQGLTVDHTHVLATPGMDAHGSYVALSRHRDGVDTALWPRRFPESGPACPHPVARSREGYGIRLCARRSGTELRRAAWDHFPRTRGRDRTQGGARPGSGVRFSGKTRDQQETCRRRCATCSTACGRYRCRAWPGRRAEAGTGSAGKEGSGRPGSGAA